MLTIITTFAQNVVRYDLHVKDSIVNFSGKERRAIAVNGQIPMPTLTFTEGDIAEIHVYNELKEGTSKRLRMAFMVNTDKEYMAGFKYIVGKNIGITSHYDSDMGFGFGVNLNY